MGFIDGTVVAIAVPAMRVSLEAGLTQVQWINNAYMLTLSSLVLVGGAFGDRFGLARVFGLGIALFMAASLVCALAPTASVLIAARLVQGVGAGFMVPGSLAVVSRAYPRELRSAAIGSWAASSAITTAAGPLIGAGLLSAGGPEMWRWIFAINLPLGAVSLILLYLYIHEDRSQPEKGIDVPGILLAILGLGCVSWALTGAVRSGWPPAPWLFAAAGVVFLVLFLIVERRSISPMLDLRLFRSRIFSAANAATFCLYFALSAVLFFLPMTVIAGWGVSEIEASMAFAPLSLFIALLSRRMGRLGDRIGAGRLVALGAAIVAAGFAILGYVIHAEAFWTQVLPAMAVMGFGMSLVVAPLSSAVMGSVEPHETGSASGVNNAVSRMAGLVSVAAMGSLAAYAYRLAGGTRDFGETANAAGHVAATNTGFAAVAYFVAGLSLLSALIALVGMRGAVLPKDQGTSSSTIR
ncbi:MFS transporter [Rhodobacteraceae bacterium ASV31]|nr:MFS transporter [Anianabacter salinae]